MSRHVVVMIATSYPRFPGDGVGSFMEPIATSVAARGHEVHLVAPWHPAIRRGSTENGVHFHFFKYALVPAMNVFGYAQGLRADTDLKLAAWCATPAALAAGWFKAMRVAQKKGATVIHAHWVIPGGVIGALAAGRRRLVVSLHGSDVFVAERHRLLGQAARRVFARAARVTACSDDLRTRAIALGARPADIETVPYGVDSGRFAPSAGARDRVRRDLGLGTRPFVFAAGRLVRKKGFEVLIDAAARLRAAVPDLAVAIAGDGDLDQDLQQRAAASGGVVTLLGNRSQDDIAALCAAADVIAVPSVHDEAGNVDGLPNFALEALASGTPVVATRVGGLPEAIRHTVSGLLVAERDSAALADALLALLRDRHLASTLGAAGRASVERDFGWARAAERFEDAYGRDQFDSRLS
jgi:glycosyltransferase involved in cell wall biosynthesis